MYQCFCKHINGKGFFSIFEYFFQILSFTSFFLVANRKFHKNDCYLFIDKKISEIIFLLFYENLSTGVVRWYPSNLWVFFIFFSCIEPKFDKKFYKFSSSSKILSIRYKCSNYTLNKIAKIKPNFLLRFLSNHFKKHRKWSVKECLAVYSFYLSYCVNV